MTKKRSTKRALLLSALSLLMCISMLVGSTFAWFTDSVVSGSNVITSGNLDIDVQYTLDGENWADLNGANDLFKKDLWEPGHTEVVVLKIENKGSLALKYVANMNIINEVIGKNKDGGDIVLSDILTVSTLTQAANDIGDIALWLAYQGENRVAYESTTSFKAANILKENQELHPGDAHYMFIKVDMAETVGNEANHDGVNAPSVEFSVNVLATQYTYEEDSFGNQYDAGAEHPATINSQEELDSAIASGEKIIKLGIGTFVIPQTPGDGYEFIGVSPEVTKIVPAQVGGKILTGTLNDLTIKNVSLEGGSGDVLRWAYGTAGKTVTFENCNLIAEGYTVHFDVLNSNLVFKDCRLTGWMSYGKNGAASFEGCEFFADGIYGILRAYSDTTLTDCTFDFAAVNTTDKYQDGIDATEGVTIKAVNCTNVNGNMSDLFEAVDIAGTDGKVVFQ